MNVQDIEKALGNLAGLVTVEKAEECWYIKTRRYLNKTVWQEINSKIKGLGGKWVGMNRDSHWEIPLANSKVKTNSDAIRHQAMILIQACKDVVSELEKLTK